VTLENLNDEIRQDFNIADDVEGVVVTSLDNDSSAAAVLEEGDVIVQVNRKPVKSIAEAVASRGNAGAAVQLKIIRSGRTRFVIVRS